MARGKKKEELSLEEKLEQALVPVEEQPYEVPGNWCWVKNHVVCYLGDGEKIAGREYPYLEVKYLRGTNESRITNKGKYIEKGTKVILVDGENSGEVFEVSEDGYMGSTFKTLNISSKIDEKYLLYFADSKRDLLRNSKTGSAIPHLNKKLFFGLKFPLPPLQEQQRIVKQIESLFVKLDEIKEKLEDAKLNMATRKKVILYKAFSGELTKEWRKSQNVKSEVWKEVQLIDILKEKPRNGYSPKPVDYETLCKSMTLSATTSGVFKPQYFKFIDEHIEENSYLWLKPGDILIQRANSLEKVGTSAIYTGDEHEFIYPDLMMKLQVIDGVSPEFITFQLKTEQVMNYIRSNATGTAGNMPKINQKVVSAIPIVLPSREEQKEIVKILKLVNDKQIKIYTLQEKVLEEIEVMRKSILRKAFRGELGTNNPEEESAIELLKTILVET